MIPRTPDHRDEALRRRRSILLAATVGGLTGVGAIGGALLATASSTTASTVPSGAAAPAPTPGDSGDGSSQGAPSGSLGAPGAGSVTLPPPQAPPQAVSGGTGR
jgi:hypothetical protein